MNYAPAPLPLVATIPPEGFRPAGKVLAAEFAHPPFLRRRRYTGRRAEGVRYERKVQAYLLESYQERYIDSPWLRFYAEGKWRWCQPDGILLDVRAGTITIIEVKYQHTSDAWWQTKQLYFPVLRALFPESIWDFHFCEVVKWYDPSTVFPERVVLAQEVTLRHTAFKVHIWHQ